MHVQMTWIIKDSAVSHQQGQGQTGHTMTAMTYKSIACLCPLVFSKREVSAAWPRGKVWKIQAGKNIKKKHVLYVGKDILLVCHVLDRFTCIRTINPMYLSLWHLWNALPWAKYGCKFLEAWLWILVTGWSGCKRPFSRSWQFLPLVFDVALLVFSGVPLEKDKNRNNLTATAPG